jgi:hypothetical protein
MGFYLKFKGPYSMPLFKSDIMLLYVGPDHMLF